MDYSALAVDLSSRLPTKTVGLATALARSGRIEEPELGGQLLSGIVVGSQRYSVSVEDVSGRHFVRCNCPAFVHGGPCKHVLALILWARDVFETVPETPDMPDDERPAPRSPQEILLRTGILKRVWRRRVHEIHFQAEAVRSERLERAAQKPAEMYVYELTTSSDLEEADVIVSVRSAKFGRDGLPTRGRELHVGRIDLSQVPTRIDLRIVRLVRSLRLETETPSAYTRASREATIPLERAGPLLRALARTGRCFLVRKGAANRHRPLRLEAGKAWRVAMRRVRTTDGIMQLRTELTRGDDVRSPDEVEAWIVPSFFVWEGTLCALHTAGDLPWLRDAIRNGPILVPEGQLDQFSDEVVEGGLAPIDGLLELEIQRDIVPRPLLQVVSETSRATPRGALGFDYDGVRVQLRDSGEILRDEESERLIARDLDAEERALGRLLRLAGVRASADAEDHEVRIVRSQLIKTVIPLIESGWLVEIEGELVRAPSAFSGAVRSGLDWFDLEGGYDYGGEVIPLPDVLAAARKGRRFISLSDGTRALIPESFEESWGALAEMAETKDGALRFARSQGWLLDALLSARDEIRADADFQQHRERLAGFKGVSRLEAPASFQGELRDYQREGLGWLEFLREFGWGGCLADDMGLGKTIQVLAALDRQREEGSLSGPSLVVAPRSVVFNWLDETARFTPKLRALDYTGTGRAALRRKFGDYDLIVTTYGTLRRDAEHLAAIEFDHAILDEAQAIKNPRSQAFKAARLLRAKHRLALTGTPVENRLSDLWTIFEFLNPGMLGRSTTFRRIVSSVGAPPPKLNSDSVDEAAEESDEGSDDEVNDAEVVASGRRLIARAVRPFLLRRTKEQVAEDLPDRTEQVIRCEMTRPQQKLYAQLRDHYRSSLLTVGKGTGKAAGARAAATGQDPGNRMMVLEALLRLRQAACHADLIGTPGRAPGPIDPKKDGGAAASAKPGKAKSEKGSEPQRAERSGKLEALLPLLEEVTTGGHKALVFSQFTGFLALLRERLDADDTPYLYLDGQTRDRKSLVDTFQSDPEQRLFLISLKAGGVGLNLTAADYVFLLDPWWNPAVEAQAIDRTHRIGQTRAVVAYRLIASGTVEEKVLDLQAEKRELAASILSQDNAVLSNLSREDLELLLS